MTANILLTGLGVIVGWAGTALWYEWFILDTNWRNAKRRP